MAARRSVSSDSDGFVSLTFVELRKWLRFCFELRRVFFPQSKGQLASSSLHVDP